MKGEPLTCLTLLGKQREYALCFDSYSLQMVSQGAGWYLLLKYLFIFLSRDMQGQWPPG